MGPNEHCICLLRGRIIVSRYVDIMPIPTCCDSNNIEIWTRTWRHVTPNNAPQGDVISGTVLDPLNLTCWWDLQSFPRFGVQHIVIKNSKMFVIEIEVSRKCVRGRDGASNITVSIKCLMWQVARADRDHMIQMVLSKRHPFEADIGWRVEISNMVLIISLQYQTRLISEVANLVWCVKVDNLAILALGTIYNAVVMPRWCINDVRCIPGTAAMKGLKAYITVEAEFGNSHCYSH